MGGKILYCHERVAGVAMGLHIFKQTKKNQKSKDVLSTVSGKQNCLL